MVLSDALFGTGDTVEMMLPMPAYVEKIQDNRTEYNNIQVSPYLIGCHLPREVCIELVQKYVLFLKRSSHVSHFSFHPCSLNIAAHSY